MAKKTDKFCNLTDKVAKYPPIKFPTKEEDNHTPINKDTNLIGASLVIIDNPTGLKHSSPQVWITYKAINQYILIWPCAGKKEEPMANTKKPKPVKNTPMANFKGMEGSLPLLPSLIHILANSGAKITTEIGLMDWNQEALNSNPAFATCSGSNPANHAGKCRVGKWIDV